MTVWFMIRQQQLNDPGWMDGVKFDHILFVPKVFCGPGWLVSINLSSSEVTSVLIGSDF